MAVIYKYNIDPHGDTIIEMPEGANIISVGLQNRTPVVWALVNPDQPLKKQNRFGHDWREFQCRLVDVRWNCSDRLVRPACFPGW